MRIVWNLFSTAIIITGLTGGIALLGTQDINHQTVERRAATVFLADADFEAPTETQERISSLPSPASLFFDDQFFSAGTKKVRLGFVGDIMLDRGVARSVEKNFGGNFTRLFENLSFLKDPDILFGNLEGPISEHGKNIGSKYSFRMEPIVAIILAQAGFDVLSVANNHIGDWSSSAFTDTLKYLKEAGIAPVGGGETRNHAEKPVIIEKNGLKTGFLAFSDVGPNWLEAKSETPGILIVGENYQEIIMKAKKEIDALVVSFHFGEEYKTQSNTRQQKLARGAIDAGADIVIGHHPHVIQEIEKYKDGLIVYSLGNFIFDQHFSEETMRGRFIEMEIAKNPFTKKIEVRSLQEKIIKLNRLFQPAEIIDTKNYKEEGGEKEEEGRATKTSEKACPADTGKDDLLLFNVNPNQGIGNHVPNDLVPIGGVCLRKAAAQAFKELAAEAGKEGLSFIITSGFRDHLSQSALYENWQKKNFAAAYKSVAPPAHSEHQLGTAIDLTTPSIKNISATDLFAKTREYDWLTQNAHYYGFVLSYPAGGEDKTGYKFEPWHWRYVGRETAIKIKESGVILTEFLN